MASEERPSRSVIHSRAPADVWKPCTSSEESLTLNFLEDRGASESLHIPWHGAQGSGRVQEELTPRTGEWLPAQHDLAREKNPCLEDRAAGTRPRQYSCVTALWEPFTPQAKRFHSRVRDGGSIPSKEKYLFWIFL